MGDGAVGKTSLLRQYHENRFQDEHIATLGLDFVTKEYIAKDGKHYKPKIWDTAGQERFKNIT